MLCFDTLTHLIDRTHESLELLSGELRSHRHCPKLRDDRRCYRLSVHLFRHCIVHRQGGNHHRRLACLDPRQDRDKLLSQCVLVQHTDHGMKADQCVALDRQHTRLGKDGGDLGE